MAQLHIHTTQKTSVSEKLHRQALAWFEDHPGVPGFLRRIVADEFTATNLTVMQRDLCGEITHIYVKPMGHHVTARVPMTEEMRKSPGAAFLGQSTPFVENITTYRVHSCAREEATQQSRKKGGQA